MSVTERWARRAGLLATLVAGILLAWVAAGAVWAWSGAPEALAPPSNTVASLEFDAPGEAVAARFSDVAALALFGEPQAQAVAAVEAPDTQLRVQLTGIAAIGVGGAAIVRVNNGAERLVRAGDALGTGDARVAEIHADRVLLERNGRYENLRLPRADGRAGESRAPAASAVNGSASTPQRSAARATEIDAAVTDPSEPDPSGPDAGDSPSTAAVPELAAVSGEPSVSRSEWLDRPERLMEVVRVRPVNRDGQFVGVSLQPTRNQREFAAAGLQPGDIVTAVNGTAVASISDPQELLSGLSSTDRIDLAIERDGSAMNLTVQLAP